MRTTGGIRWCASLDDDVRSGTAAWIVGLDTCGDYGLPAPNSTDRADIGARRGVLVDRFLLRRQVLRSLVGRWCGVPAVSVVIGYGRDGWPEVRYPPNGPRCSVAARGDIAGFAISTARVGIDLEPVEPGEIAWAALSPRETADLQAEPEAARLAAFLDIWTVKEAYLKALGAGLLREPAEITVSIRTLRLRDGAELWRPSASAVQRISCGAQAVVAACVSLP